MKRTGFPFVIILFAACLLAPSAFAQDIPGGYELVDSVIYRPVAAVDTTLAGVDVFDIMPSKAGNADADVNVRQSQKVADSMRSYVKANSGRTMGGYRVRIFFDNKQSARTESESVLKKFSTLYPEVKAYRIYANPYFKVTVGDFRTKSEAMALLARIKGAFPSAFVVKENIEYPVVDSDNAVIADTVKVLRPIGNTVGNQ